MRLFARALSLESLYDSILTGERSQALDHQQLDPERMEQLARQESLLDALDSWIQAPNPLLYNRLQALSEFTRSIYTFPTALEIYRGFDLQSPYQNTMGLASRGLLCNEEKPDLAVGQQHYYDGDEPLSWTTDAQLAESFGPCVVRLQINAQLADYLVVTPEMCALICKRRNIDPQTQKEVILLPPVNIRFQIHALK